MKMKHTQTDNSSYTLRKSKIRKQREKRKLFMQIFFMLILFSAIAGYYCKYSFLRFIIILSVEIIGVSFLILLSIYITYSMRKNEKDSNKRIQPPGQKYAVKSMPTRRLVKLDQRNFDWSDEDIQRKQQDSMLPGSTSAETEKEGFSYRSPFEPINPPARKHEDKTNDEDRINDEDKENDEDIGNNHNKENDEDKIDENKISEKQKIQSPPKYKVKVIRKKKKKDKSVCPSPNVLGPIHTKKKIQDKNL